jgi:hypothetical protein
VARPLWTGSFFVRRIKRKKIFYPPFNPEKPLSKELKLWIKTQIAEAICFGEFLITPFIGLNSVSGLTKTCNAQQFLSDWQTEDLGGVYAATKP